MKYMRCEKGRWHINKGHTANSLVDLDPTLGFVSLTQSIPSSSLSAPPCTLPTLASPQRANCWSLSLLSLFRHLYLWTCSFVNSYGANLTHSSRLQSIHTCSVNSLEPLCGVFSLLGILLLPQSIHWPCPCLSFLVFTFKGEKVLVSISSLWFMPHHLKFMAVRHLHQMGVVCLLEDFLFWEINGIFLNIFRFFEKFVKIPDEKLPKKIPMQNDVYLQFHNEKNMLTPAWHH